eukprot:TRINITY_DN10294_c0_g2_i1.p1 TRINITY_DN10294_c0_g2~~TRINITY_DN10294_c0_g2_i1.p1  ORF type:complete len:613 (+),score=48.24 TRINITY_DN10294_c0_g2_i1:98-1936(+)
MAALGWAASRFLEGFPSHTIHFSTLKFRSPATEDAYVRHSVEGMSKSLFMLSGIAIVLTSVCAAWSRLNSSYAKSEQQRDVFRVMGIAWFVAVAMACATCFFCKPTRVIKMPFATEIVILLVCHLAILLQLPMDRGYVTAVRGFDNREVWGHLVDFSDTRILLNLDVIVTITHIMVPIRWHYLVLVEFSGLLMYIGMIISIGSPSDQLATNIHCFVTLIFLASVGKRTSEISQRKNFLKIISEKTKRTEAEFRLDKANDLIVEDTRIARSDQSSQVESAHSKTPSSLVFGSEEISLSDIIRLGESEQWLVDKEHIDVCETSSLGVGSFGTVQRASYYGSSVAVKQCNPLVKTQASIAMACNELRILRRMRHPHIVSFYGAIVDFERFTITLVMELVRGHSLGEYLVQDGSVDFTPSLRQKLLILSSTCGALHYLHRRSPIIIHGDLKPSNIMVERVLDSKRWCVLNAKLVDFGLSRLIKPHSKPLGGSPQWVAPEVVQLNGDLELPTASDVYSLGRISFTFFTGVSDERNIHDIIRSLLAGEVQPLRWPENQRQNRLMRPLMPIVDSCCLQTAIERPKVETVQQVFAKMASRCVPEPFEVAVVRHPETRCSL